MRAALVLIGSLFAAAGIAAPASQPLPADLMALQPVSLLPADLAANIRFRDRSGAAKPSVLTPVVSAGTASLFRIETFTPSQDPAASEAVFPADKPVKKGDICLARFSVRSLYARQESGEAVFNCYFQQSRSPWSKSVMVQLGAGPEWTNFDIPFQAEADSEAGASALYFSFGILAQSLEITNIEVLDFGSRTTIDKLPATRFTYPGREAGAAWRTEALARIEKIRTAPLKITVLDSRGKPVPGAKVAVRLVQPEFAWGSAVDSALIAASTPDAEKYRDKIIELFDTVTIENGLKWQSWMGADRRADTLRAVDWVVSNGLRLRGHNLVWPGWKFSPRRLNELPDPKPELPGLIDAHILEEVTATRGKIWAWDVLNEPVHERDFFKYMPEATAAEWFKQARKVDPQPLLFVNEYGMLNSRTSPDMIARYLAFIKTLQANGAPVDGIGVQGHIGRQVRSPADVLADLDLLKAANLPIHITEFDINSKDEQLQADYTRDFLIAIYSHPSVTGFIQWGFWQPRHWKPDAAMYRADWTEKPSAAVWREWVLNTWRTRAAGTTDATGSWHAPGAHFGEYEITAVIGARTITKRVTHKRDNPGIRIAL